MIITCSNNKSEPIYQNSESVEAISIAHPDKSGNHGPFTWVGINQNKANRYVEHFFLTGQLASVVPLGGNLCREITVHEGTSKIDFKVGNVYVECKTPLIWLPTENHPSVETKDKKFNSFSRLIKVYII